MPADLGPNLKWACKEFSPSIKRTRYAKYWRYYEGIHDLRFATEKFKTTFGEYFREFAENLCPAVVDSYADRLEVTGFQSSESVTDVQDVSVSDLTPTVGQVTVTDEWGEKVMEIWDRNRMETISGEVHEEAIKLGDSYVLVWPNDNLEAEIWPQCGDEVVVQYDPNNKKEILRAAKTWKNDVTGKWYLNIYTRDGITKYASKKTPANLPTEEESWSSYEFVPNPYSRVPIFHFANRAERRPGTSRLRDVIALQDGLNKSVMDMLIAMEFASFKQRWVVGIDPEIDDETGQPKDENLRKTGVDRMLTFADPETTVGQFDATELGQFLRVQEKFWASTARVTGTPLHYFLIVSGDFPSGEAMKSAEARFTKEILDGQTSFGNSWEDVMLFALEVDGQTPPDDLRLTTLWTNPAPRSEAELADTAVKKQAVGVSRSQILKELGYAPEEIVAMLKESDSRDASKAKLEMDARAQQNGNVPGSGQTQAENNTRGVRQQ